MYQLCLVTDRKILKNRDLYKVVEESIENGVTMIQLREKDITLEEFVKIGKKLKEITDRYDIPLIINDNVQVAKIIDASGVHLGQSDMCVADARIILGDKKIIGLSVSNLLEAENAVKEKIDYIGVGPIYATGSKNDAAAPMGLEMLKEIREKYNLPIIAIGGIEESNVEDVMSTGIEGVAVISAILGGENIEERSKGLINKINKKSIINNMKRCLRDIKTKTPLVFHLTNLVTINDCANITLSAGGSPLMSFCKDELEEIIGFSSSVIINIGTMEESMTKLAVEVARIANRLYKPVILDPVGVGATKSRVKLVDDILKSAYIDVIKGNLSEIKTILLQSSKARGVDSLDKVDETTKDLVKNGAKKLGCILAITGEIDYISDGKTIIEISNGNPLMEKVTGTGCMINSLIGSYIGASGISLENVATGVAAMSIVGERACESFQGNGTLKINILDGISNFNEKVLEKYEKIKVY